MFSDKDVMREKIKGEFSLKVNSKLSMPRKIEKFANDSAAFYMHKSRNFLEKLDEQMKNRLVKEVEEKKL
jgi:hypothetical protein